MSDQIKKGDARKINPSGKSMEELLRIAYTDELTGLFNRRYLRENVRGYLSRLREKNLPLAMLMLDIDHFKEVNDTHGHQAGDQLLKGFATLIKKLSAGKAIPVRYAGDEFVIVVPKYDKKVGGALAKKLIEILDKGAMRISQEKKVKITSSIGIASFPKDAADYDDLFKRADEALYHAKETGRARFFIYPDDKRMISPDLVSSLFPLETPVGRDREVAYLTDYILSELKEIPVITGEVGMGKSYLLRWAEKRAKREKLQIFSISGHPFWKMQPLAALFSGIAHYRQKHIHRFKEILPRLTADSREIILDRLDLERTDKGFPPDTIVSAPTEFLLRVIDYGKTIVMVDDLQQVDGDTIRFLNSFFHQFRDKPVYPIFSYQMTRANPTGMIPVMGMLPLLQSRIKGMNLEGLTKDDVSQYLIKLLRKSPFSDEEVRILYENCDGKPLFVQEVVKYLISSGKLDFEIDHWIKKDIKATDLSTSMQRISKERLKKLPKESVEILSTASHIGESFDIRMLSKLLKKPEGEIAVLLRKPEEEHIIIEAVGQEGDFTFVNPIDKNVLTDMLSKEEQKKLHRKIVEIEEKFAGGNTSRVLGRLMFHLNQGSMWRQAAQLYQSSETSYIGGQVSDQALAKLQQRTMTKSLAQETPLDDEDLKKAVRTIRNLKIAIQNLKLYPKSNENVQNSIERVYDDISYFFTKTEGLSFSTSRETLIINGSEPPVKDLGSIAEDFYAILNSHALQGIFFVKGMKLEELMSFLEIISEKFDGPIDWDTLLDEKNIETIVPDRKVYVAMGEHKIVLGGSEKVVVGNKEGAVEGSGGLGEEALEEYKVMMETFRDDARELIKSLHSGNVDSDKLLELTYLLREIDKKELPTVAGEVDKETLAKIAIMEKEPAPKKDLPPDQKSVEDAEKDIENNLINLSSDDKEIRSKAAGMLKGLNEKLPRVIFDFISTENSPQVNRLAVYIVKNSGEGNIRAFLNYLKPNLPKSKLNALLRILDIFGDIEILYRQLAKIIPLADNKQIAYIEKMLLSVPPEKAQRAIVSLLDVAPVDVKIRLLKSAGILKVRGVSRFVKEILVRPFFWEKWENTILVAEAAKACGSLPDIDAEIIGLLHDLVKPHQLTKANVPSQIRVAAFWALTELNDPGMEKLLPKLIKDKDSRIASQAMQIIKR